MDKRILALLVATTMGSTAYAQTKGPDPVRHGPPAVTGAAGATRMSATPPKIEDGYVTSSARTAVIDSEHHCVHTGSWSPAVAAEPCDAVPTASAPAPVVAEAPQPAPAPLAEAAPPPVIEKMTLSADVLFPFNKAELLPGGKDKLDNLAKDAQGANVDKVVLDGYADRIGSQSYNKDLSERRAQAVADYLASKGVDKDRIQAEGHGKDNPVTGDDCSHMGPAKASNHKLVACLQPDRRVEAELLGSREQAATGATSTGNTGGSTGAGESTNGSTQ